MTWTLARLTLSATALPSYAPRNTVSAPRQIHLTAILGNHSRGTREQGRIEAEPEAARNRIWCVNRTKSKPRQVPMNDGEAT